MTGSVAAQSAGSVVIIGAGHGGVQAADSLRTEGYEDPVVLIDADFHHPYQRPPLSKEYLAGIESDPMPLRAESFFASRRIEFVRDARVTSIDRDRREVELGNGSRLRWAHLIIATGADARELAVPGGDRRGVHKLRSVDDAARLRNDLVSATQAVVIGAGFIGLEFAAVAATLGISVTVVEQADRALARAVSAVTADHLVGLLRDAGVRFEFGAVVSAVHGENGEISSVVTNAGELDADLVVVGVGVRPRDELAIRAGLEVDGGIVVNATLRTSDPDIYAIGDVAATRISTGTTRIECVQNAVDQGRYAAEHILGLRVAPYEQIARFWSHQGKARLQIAGLAEPGDDAITAGDAASGSFSVRRFRSGRLVAVESLDQPREHMRARQELAQIARCAVPRG